MPCCLLLIMGLLGPRVAIAFLALFTTYLNKPFDGLLLPLLGLIFLPWTTLAYVWAINARGELSGLFAVLIIVAALVDLGLLGGGVREQRRRGVVVR